MKHHEEQQITFDWRFFFKGYLISVVITLLVAFLSFFGILRQYENWWLDLSLRLKSHAQPGDFPIVIVGIDDRTMLTWGYDKPILQPVTPREELGELLEAITITHQDDPGLMPAIIAVDIFFDMDAPGTNELQESLDAIHAGPHSVPVILGQLIVIENNAVAGIAPSYVSTPDPGHMGYLAIGAERFDRVIRWFQPRALFQGDRLDSFGYLIAESYNEVTGAPIDLEGNDFTNLQIQYLGPSSSYPFISATDAEEALRNGELAGKIVLIGRTDSATSDHHSTPRMPVVDGENYKAWPKALNNEMYGVEIRANIVATLLAERYIPEPRPFNELLSELFIFCPLLAMLFSTSMKKYEFEMQILILVGYFVVSAIVSPSWKYLTNPIPAIVGLIFDLQYGKWKDHRKTTQILKTIIGNEYFEKTMQDEQYRPEQSMYDAVFVSLIPHHDETIERERRKLAQSVVKRTGGMHTQHDSVMAHIESGELEGVLTELSGTIAQMKGLVLVTSGRIFRYRDVQILVSNDHIATRVQDSEFEGNILIDEQLLAYIGNDFAVGPERITVKLDNRNSIVLRILSTKKDMEDGS